MAQLGKKYYIGSIYQEKFLESLARGKIACVRCKGCQLAYFPPRQICPHCKTVNEELSWLELDGQGSVYSFTTINYPPIGFEDEAPYTLVIVELEEGPKVLCRATMPLEIEDKVKVTAHRDDDVFYLQCYKLSE